MSTENKPVEEQMKNIFKFYPDKSKKPTAKTVFVGFLYDFGWIIIILLIYVLANYQSAPTENIFITNIQAYALLFAIVCGQFLALELALSWSFYYLSNKRNTKD